MEIKQAEFVMSNVDPSACPPPNKPEFAFIGRSNVGKSSLINLLVNRRQLAKTSSTPGKTRLINHFIINNRWYLVDLPGYGFASTSKSVSRGWGPMIETYLSRRANLVTTFVLIDARLEPQPIDANFIQWMGTSRMPFAMVFTKADKISRKQLEVTQSLWAKKLGDDWEELPPSFVTSATDRRGRTEVLAYINSLLSNN